MVVLKTVSSFWVSIRGIYKEKILKPKQASKHLNLDYRVKASTLMETLVATVLIVVVFMIASMILNNLFSNTIKNNTRGVEAHLNELNYLYFNDKLRLPYHDVYKQWEISVVLDKNSNQNTVVFEAENSKTNQNILKEIIAN